ncbi:hypothetical protein GUITHDRAFT_153583, partial [Guillardia theta CCMP2712]
MAGEELERGCKLCLAGSSRGALADVNAFLSSLPGASVEMRPVGPDGTNLCVRVFPPGSFSSPPPPL